MMKNKSGLFGIVKFIRLIKWVIVGLAVYFLYIFYKNDWDVGKTFSDVGDLLGKLF